MTPRRCFELLFTEQLEWNDRLVRRGGDCVTDSKVQIKLVIENHFRRSDPACFIFNRINCLLVLGRTFCANSQRLLKSGSSEMISVLLLASAEKFMFSTLRLRQQIPDSTLITRRCPIEITKSVP